MNIFPRRTRFGLDRFFDDSGMHLTDRFGGEKFFAPRVDIHEKKNKYLIEAELPGVDAKDLDVEIDHGVLTISATTESENTEREDGKIICEERHKGSYQRSFYLGEEIDETKVEAKFKHGVLKLNVPKPQGPHNKKRVISVR